MTYLRLIIIGFGFGYPGPNLVKLLGAYLGA